MVVRGVDICWVLNVMICVSWDYRTEHTGEKAIVSLHGGGVGIRGMEGISITPSVLTRLMTMVNGNGDEEDDDDTGDDNLDDCKDQKDFDDES